MSLSDNVTVFRCTSGELFSNLRSDSCRTTMPINGVMKALLVLVVVIYAALARPVAASHDRRARVLTGKHRLMFPKKCLPTAIKGSVVPGAKLTCLIDSDGNMLTDV